MASVANLHIRDVPPEAVAALKSAAVRHRRSLNAELIQALVAHADREQRSADLLERLEEGRRRFKEAFPEGYPPGLEPETIIRRDRERDDLV